MREFALWRLDWSDPMYGTGPESEIANRGGRAEGIVGPDILSADILGTVTGDFDTEGLEAWAFRRISTDEARAFLATFSTMTIDEAGQVIAA